MKQYRHIAYFLLTLLLLAGVANQAWAQTEVTYHILALPMNHATGTKNTNASYDGFRVEAVKVVAQSSTIVLPDHFKSPLAKNFTYYAADFVTKGSVVAIYPNQSGAKYQLYTAPIAPYIKVTKSGGAVTEEASTEAAWTAHPDGSQNTATNATDYSTQKGDLVDGTHYFKMTTLKEGDPIGAIKEIYVTYEYDADNTIAKLDGSVAYNISMYSGTNASKKGFLALNRGRNNRLTIVPADKVSSSDLISDDFVYIDVSDTDMKTYWQSGDNWNDKNVTASNFHFLFKYIGEDPYNITICTAYDKDKYYIEKFANDIGQVNKYYKESSVYFAPSTNNPELFITSDVDKKYTSENTSKTSLVSDVDSEDKPGWYRQLAAPIWNSFAILDVKYIDPSKTGHVFLATRTHNANGTFNGPTKSGNNYQYNYIQAERNAMKIVAQTPSTAVSKYTVDDEIYEVEDVNFKIVTQFGNEITASVQLSKYSIEHENISNGDIPAELNRKYVNYTSKFYKDAALTHEITSYIDAYDEETDKYNVYVGYEMSNAIPFKAIKPTDSYTTATWYELTDFESDQSSGKKLKYDDGTNKFKNNGANEVYDKYTEFAFVGDPYELRILYRDATETAKANRYVGGSSNLDISTSDYISNSANISYGTSYTFETENLATGTKTITFNVSGLKGDKKIKVTTGGTDASQIASISPDHSSVTAESSTTQTYTVTLNANNGVAKTMTITIQEYDTDGTTPIGTATVITINQSTGGYLWGWEIPADDTDGSFELRQYGSSSGTSKFWQWDTASSGSVVNITTTSTRVKKMDLPTFTYTYNVVDLAGNIAIKATASQTIFSDLTGFASIPEVIRSPFLADETITFYGSYANSNGDGVRDRRDWHYAYSGGVYTPSEQTPITQTPATNGANIYVAYTTKNLKDKSIKLIYNEEFNVKLNGEYIYWNSAEGANQNKILSKSLSSDADELSTKPYLWHLRGRDPYSMRIDNVGASDGHTDPKITINVYDTSGDGTFTTEEVNGGMFVKVDGAWADNTALIFVNDRNTASRFVAMMSIYTGVYEVLAATGTTDYYHIGRPSIEGAETKVYKTTTYDHGADELQFELSGKDAIKYILVDKAGRELLESSSHNPRLTLPAEFVSPLVETYYYYPTKAQAEADVTTGNHTGNITEPNQITDDQKRVWVTYTVNDRVNFNDNASPYLLKFLNPFDAGYYLEDGNDKLTTEKIQAVYPYTNGDGSLNIYGTAMNKEQMDGGANTRPRWVWFFESENNDPYHVKIHSKSTISYNSVSHPTYLQTYAVHFKQDEDANTKHVVTGGFLPGIASVAPTEYMILGLPKKYKLLTTNEIEGARRTVNSLEQYWKTYNMIKQHLLEIAKSADAFSNDETTWVVPETERTALNAKLAEKGIGSGAWHSYDVIANAVRWNGYNDKPDGHEKKVVEKLEHWFQTFDMGDGTFDIENANIPPVLVLLDRHGWEIMRKPLPTTTYPGGEELKDLKAYDSPMVKEYKFYSNATKATGCHKYTLRMQNGAERDQIKYGGKHYTSTSLADLPPISATGVKDNADVLQDQYVTYTVKDEYENSYQYHLELHEEDQTFVESGTSSKFLILQNQRFARDNGSDNSYLSKPIFEGTNPYDPNANAYDMILSPSQTQVANQSTNVDTNKDGIIDDINLWYVQPNLNIDKEMGIKWAGAAGGSSEPLTEYETKKAYKDKTGFDPYNIQLKNAYNDKYLTSHMTTTSLNNGIMVGGYDGGNNSVTLSTWVDVKDNDTYTPNGNEGYDHTYIQLTNQTFMAVQDVNGNMQLMPRFDHTKRMNVVNSSGSSYTTLQDPETHAKASIEDNSSMGPQVVFMIRPQVFEYHIIDHQGREALRYKTTGEYSPAIKEHFKSPLATDFKFYFDHAAYSTLASNKASYTAAATSDYFKKTADDETAMATAAKALTVVDDYYFKIGTSTYTYKKVTVTKGYVAGSPATDASYTATSSTEEEWNNAVAYQRSADNEAAMQTAVVSLAAKGLYYYQLGTYKYYKKVTVSGETKTTTDSSLSEYESHEGGNQQSATDASDFTTKVKDLSNGTYYYEIGPLHSYQKVVVTNVNGSSSLLADVAAHKDISDREITGSFADADLNDLKNQVYVRYSYDEEADANQILQGKWFTMKLADKDDGVVANGTLNADGTGVSLFKGTSKPDPVNNDDRAWQWKFLAAPTDAANIDPYALKIYNRDKNYDAAKRNVGIKVNGSDRFALLNHSTENDYALAVAGAGLSDPEYNYTYTFLNGAPMTTGVEATTVEETNQFTVADDAAYETARDALTANGVYYFKITSHDEENHSTYASYMKVTVTSGPSRAEEASSEADWSNALAYYNNSNQYHFTIKSNALSDDSKLILIDDVDHEYNYKVINNDDSGNILAISGTQTKAEAVLHTYTPYLPVTIQTLLLNDDDYLYYEKAATIDDKGNADPSDDSYTFTEIPQLTTLCGLYDDEVYVRYKAYNMDDTEYEVPNKRNTKGGSTIAVASDAKYAALNISGGLPYNIIWEGDKMMSVSSSTISDGGSKDLNGDTENVWSFDGNDPYALKIKHKKSGEYIYNSDGTNCALGVSGTPFMLLRNGDDYKYGILQVTGGTNKLTDYGQSLTSGVPTKFFIFALSTHRLIYHLIINTSNEKTTIPYRTGTEDAPGALKTKDITGTSQRDLTSSIFGIPGDRYQLGSTIFGRTYSYDAGEVSIGDVLDVPNVFERPNCTYFYYVDNIQQGGSAETCQKTATSDDDLIGQANALTALGNYYYKLDGQYIYRKVQVTEANDGVKDAAYEISLSSESEYTEKSSSLTATDAEDLKSKADALTETGAYYYKVGPIDIYKRVHVTAVTPITYSVSECTLDDWTNVWQDNSTLNDKYKGLEITKLMSDADLIGGLVQINIAYAFQTGLETNAGEGFVTDLSQNLWYTFETQDGLKPYLAQYTNAWGLQAKAGRDTRYTNDYLWSPLGDVYGFKMYNRYMLKNSTDGDKNMMTMSAISEGQKLLLAQPYTTETPTIYPAGYEVFELLGSNNPGYFRIHPVVNNTGTQYYVRKDPTDNYAKISTNYSEWTFNLPLDLLKPYIERKGYVGGLTKDAYDEKKTVLDKVMDGTASYADLLTVQGIVYDDDNIVKYKRGYYRLHSQPGVSGISPVRYASGYLHALEKGSGPSTAIPMHFFSKKGVSTTFGGLNHGFTSTNATRGEIPVPSTEYDPSTVFYFEGAAVGSGNPTSTMQTQGLYVAANLNGDTDDKGSGNNRLQRAVMSANSSDALNLTLMDIGGAVLLIHDGADPSKRIYLNFDQSNTFQKTATNDADMITQVEKLTSKGTYYFKIGESSYTYKKIKVNSGYVSPSTEVTYEAAVSSTETEWNKASDIYDLKYYHDSPTEDAKWCMVPADSLMVTMNNGGDDYYYSTFCAPFDVLLPDDVVKDAVTTKAYYAYTCNTWNDKNLHPKKVDAVSGTPSYAAGKFVPAGTPVIFRIKDESGSMKLTLPSSSPSTKLSSVFSGKYLEQLLTPDASHDVYTLGLPFTTPVTINRTTGAITAELPEKANSGLGFYINATPNKENGELQSLWLKNNNYVLHNKIYYRYDNKDTNDPVGAPAVSPQFVPVIFDDLEEQDEELNPEGAREIVGDGCVYDLMGRKVATREQVEDGSWRQRVATGIYILNGRKFQKK